MYEANSKVEKVLIVIVLFKKDLDIFIFVKLRYPLLFLTRMDWLFNLKLILSIGEVMRCF